MVDNAICVEDPGFNFKIVSVFIEHRLRYRFFFKIADTFSLF